MTKWFFKERKRSGDNAGIDISRLTFVFNERVTPVEVGALREAVGWDARTDRYALILPTAFLYIGCYDGDDLVGFVRTISDGVDDAVIFDLAVLEKYRSLGIGSRLIDLSIARCAEMGVKAVNVLYEPQLARFYHKRGFIQICSGVIDTEIMDGPWRQYISE